MSQQLTAVSARWTLLPRPDGGIEPAEGVTVLVRGGRIENVVRRPFDGTADHRVELPGGVLLPGFVNLHNHAINGPIFRGIVDDVVEQDRPGVVADNIVYSLLLPLGDLAGDVLSDDEPAGGLPARDARAAAVGHHQRPRHAAGRTPLDDRGGR